MKFAIFLLLLVSPLMAQKPCNLKLSQSPVLREGLKLGMDIGTVSKNFDLLPDKETGTDVYKKGRIQFDDAVFDVYFHDDQLTYIYASYYDLDQWFDTTEEFAKIIPTKFKITAPMFRYYDPVLKESGLGVVCTDFNLAVFAPNKLALQNNIFFRQLEAKEKAEKAAENKRKVRIFKP